jgi:hypothetical protein
MNKVVELHTNVSTNVKQQYMQYLDGPGGAYCMIEQSEAVPLPLPFMVSTVKGPVMQEVVQSYAYGHGLTQRVRLTPSRRVLEFIHDGGELAAGRELISRLTTDLMTGGTAGGSSGSSSGGSGGDGGGSGGSGGSGEVWQDASGFVEMHRRPMNYSGSIGQNYHALVQTACLAETSTNTDTAASTATNSSSSSSISSSSGGGGGGGTSINSATVAKGRLAKGRQLALLTRRTMGVASLGAGQIEYMLMRRMADASDNQGPWPLDDAEPMVADRLWLLLGQVRKFHNSIQSCGVRHAESTAARSQCAVVCCFGYLHIVRFNKTMYYYQLVLLMFARSPLSLLPLIIRPRWWRRTASRARSNSSTRWCKVPSRLPR